MIQENRSSPVSISSAKAKVRDQEQVRFFAQAEKCWICLEGAEEREELSKMPCSCPRYAHLRCLARWQLHSAGTRKETHCEFCDQPLPDWRKAFPLTNPACSSAKITVSFSGVVHKVDVKPGPDGYESFERSIRQVFGLPEDAGFSIAFTCDEPAEPDIKFNLRGKGAYDAAVHCAQLTAARNMARIQPEMSSSTSSCNQAVSRRNFSLSLTNSFLRVVNELRCASRQAVDVHPTT
uniref:RING-CH-type domain-containing protein n=1 Tax=Tetraselmis sp. GSL018 TaxID=582737 RepID=A0A061S133_9CHLO